MTGKGRGNKGVPRPTSGNRTVKRMKWLPISTEAADALNELGQKQPDRTREDIGGAIASAAIIVAARKGKDEEMSEEPRGIEGDISLPLERGENVQFNRRAKDRIVPVQDLRSDYVADHSEGVRRGSIESYRDGKYRISSGGEVYVVTIDDIIAVVRTQEIVIPIFQQEGTES